MTEKVFTEWAPWRPAGAAERLPADCQISYRIHARRFARQRSFWPARRYRPHRLGDRGTCVGQICCQLPELHAVQTIQVKQHSRCLFGTPGDSPRGARGHEPGPPSSFLVLGFFIHDSAYFLKNESYPIENKLSYANTVHLMVLVNIIQLRNIFTCNYSPKNAILLKPSEGREPLPLLYDSSMFFPSRLPTSLTGCLRPLSEGLRPRQWPRLL